jgi:hypothetical protein
MGKNLSYFPEVFRKKPDQRDFFEDGKRCFNHRGMRGKTSDGEEFQIWVAFGFGNLPQGVSGDPPEILGSVEKQCLPVLHLERSSGIPKSISGSV